MASSYNGFRMKQKASIPATADTGESILWVNSADSNTLYLNGDKVSSTPTSNPTVDPNFQGWTQTDQTGAGYTSSKQLSFNTDSLKTVATSATETTLEFADDVTKNYETHNYVINYGDSLSGYQASAYDHCKIIWDGSTGAQSYSATFGGDPNNNGIGLDIRYADSGIGRPILSVNSKPDSTNRNVIIGDAETSQNFIEFDCHHPNGGNFQVVKNNVEKINFTGNNLNIENCAVRIGDISGGDYLEVSSSGSLNGYHNNNLSWYISPDGSHTFGLGENNTIVFNSQNNTGDIFSVTQNTISKVAKLSAETVNSVADMAWRVNVWMGAQYMEYNTKSLFQYIIDEVNSYFFS